VDIERQGIPSTKKCDKTKELLHAGIDIAAPEGSNICPIANGVVVDVINSPNTANYDTLGNMLIIKHDGDNLYSIYCHMMDGSVKTTVGKKVYGGATVIGCVGHTGAAFGTNHLHLEVRRFGGSIQDRFFSGWGNIYGIVSENNSKSKLLRDLQDNWIDPQRYN